MKTKLSLHQLMADDQGFLRAIRVPNADQERLRDAREAIRATLRSAFRNWTSFVSKAEMQDAVVLRETAGAVVATLPAPKFRIQGSFAYHTANDCQDPPTQQIDQDDGVFLPISFVTVNGMARPTIASSAYFRIVERALKPLCDAKGWTLNPRKPKASCVRVEIGAKLHIDLPLYAIRDEAFDRLVEFAATESLAKSIDMRDSRELDEKIYRNLANAEIILAHRDEGWIESDPRRLEDWFKGAIRLYGEPVRLLSRCFKGLRDARFDDGLSSICIMACVVRAIENMDPLDPKRIDVAIVGVAREMARVAGLPVDNPVFPGDAAKRFCVDWTPDYRAKVRALFADAADQLEEAMDGTYHKGLALQRVRQAFGQRVPDDESLIALTTAAEAVRSVPPVRQPAAVVPRTKSG